MTTWIPETGQDDDFPPLDRNTVGKLRELAARVEEIGGIHLLTAEDAKTIADTSKLLRLPGVKEFLEAQSERHSARVYWTKLRKMWWGYLAWVLAGLAGLATLLSQLDGALVTVKKWLP